MSNLTSKNFKNISLEEINHQKYLDFLGSPDFLTNLQSYNLSKKLFNELFAAHCLTIIAQSTGISSGGIRFNYCTSTQEHFTKNVPGPHVQYYFYTTQNSLIQPGLYCCNTSRRIKNKHNYSFNDSRSVRDFLDNYFLNMKHFPEKKLVDFNDYKFDIKFSKKNIHSIITENIFIRSFLRWHFMNNKLENKNLIIKNKLKI